MVLESVDLSACLFLLVAGSLMYIIVVGKSLSTMSLYVFFFLSLSLCFVCVLLNYYCYRKRFSSDCYYNRVFSQTH